jgi:hypothetical protein
MSISHIGKSVKESVTLKLNVTAALLREKGDPVIHLGGGEPKSKAPLDAHQRRRVSQLRRGPVYSTRRHSRSEEGDH